jgi:RNA polymerase-binding transcription factor DksA
MSSYTAPRQRGSLTTAQVHKLKAQLRRESERFGRDDIRSHVFATAMRRIEQGTYGYCATCDTAISYERLSVMPETTYCVRCRATRA